MADRLALEDEIEITPEMIEAGVSEFVSYNDAEEPPDAVVIRIIKAVLGASLLVSLAREVEVALSPYRTEPERTSLRS